MLIKFNFEKVTSKLTLNQYFLLVKIYLYLFYQYNFKYSGAEHIDNLINLKYITEDDKNRLNLSESALKEINSSMRIDPLGKLDQQVHNINLDALAEEMINIFPKGKKDGRYPWRSSKSIITDKLRSFFNKYGKDEYSNEQIINATKGYVNGFRDNDTGMSLLKYFIEKKGNGSLLLDCLEAGEDGDSVPTIDNTTTYL